MRTRVPSRGSFGSRRLFVLIRSGRLLLALLAARLLAALDLDLLRGALDVHGDLARLRLLAPREREGEDPVLARRLDLRGIDHVGERDRALVAAVDPLRLVLGALLALDPQRVAEDLDLHVLRIDPGELRAEQDPIALLLHVEARGEPHLSFAGDLARAAEVPEELAEEPVHVAPQREERNLERVVAGRKHGHVAITSVPTRPQASGRERGCPGRRLGRGRGSRGEDRLRRPPELPDEPELLEDAE